MDQVLNGYAPDRTWNFSKFTKVEELTDPGPAGIFGFGDENDKSINDGLFGVFRRGMEYWSDTPANRHGQAANFSYVDGHAKKQQWLWPKFCDPGEYDYAPRDGPGGRDARDLHWLQNQTPR